MKRFALLVVLAAACRTVPVSPGGSSSSMSGGATARDALDRFLGGARNQDLQAVGAIFGNSKGPLREQEDRAIIERQLLIQLRCLRHEKATVSGPTRGAGGTEIYTVDLTQGKLSASVPFTLVRGPASRWYVLEFKIETLQNQGFCS